MPDLSNAYGSPSDAPVTDVTRYAGLIPLLKGMISVLQAGLSVTISGTPAVTLSGTNNQVKVQDGTNTLLMDSSGRPSVVESSDGISVGASISTPSFATIAVSASGATTLVNAVSNKRIRVISLVLVVNAAVNVKFQSHVTPTDITGLFYCAANGGIVLPDNPHGWFQTVSGEALDINLSGAVSVGGCLSYITV